MDPIDSKGMDEGKQDKSPSISSVKLMQVNNDVGKSEIDLNLSSSRALAPRRNYELDSEKEEEIAEREKSNPKIERYGRLRRGGSKEKNSVTRKKSFDKKIENQVFKSQSLSLHKNKGECQSSPRFKFQHETKKSYDTVQNLDESEKPRASNH